MQFDPENDINKLCAQGMQMEGEGRPEEALKLFQLAWDEATTTVEKVIAAHYLARQQDSIAGKLQWDETALNLALTIADDEVRALYPSLYLNVAKCYEDMKDPARAQEHYRLALKFTSFLPHDGYGNMIRAGINKGIERTLLNSD
jgi:tetratricopeptide (TPR) repeat protein